MHMQAARQMRGLNKLQKRAFYASSAPATLLQELLEASDDEGGAFDDDLDGAEGRVGSAAPLLLKMRQRTERSVRTRATIHGSGARVSQTRKLRA